MEELDNPRNLHLGDDISIWRGGLAGASVHGPLGMFAVCVCLSLFLCVSVKQWFRYRLLSCCMLFISCCRQCMTLSCVLFRSVLHSPCLPVICRELSVEMFPVLGLVEMFAVLGLFSSLRCRWDWGPSLYNIDTGVYLGGLWVQGPLKQSTIVIKS